MNRRDFLKGMAGILAAGVAPGVVQSKNIMRVNPDHIIVPETAAYGEESYGGGLTNFTALTEQERAMWSHTIWKKARDQSFYMRIVDLREAHKHNLSLWMSDKVDEIVLREIL